MFLGLGAYGAAVIAGTLGIKHFEIVLAGVAIAAVVVALPIGFMCVRYTGIFFGMLTLAFGMLAHSFLFKFYDITGGDSGMRVPRMSLLGMELSKYNKIQFLAGPFYFYCLALLIIAAFIMWRVVNSPFGLHLKAVGKSAEGRVCRRKAQRLPPCRIRHLGDLRCDRRRHSRFPCRCRRPRVGSLDALGASRVHDRAGRLQKLSGPGWRGASDDVAAGSVAIADAILAVCAGVHSGGSSDLLPRRLGGHRFKSLIVTLGKVETGDHRVTALVETKNVSKFYGSFRALDNVSVSISAGEFVSIVGPNGAGRRHS